MSSLLKYVQLVVSCDLAIYSFVLITKLPWSINLLQIWYFIRSFCKYVCIAIFKCKFKNDNHCYQEKNRYLLKLVCILGALCTVNCLCVNFFLLCDCKCRMCIEHENPSEVIDLCSINCICLMWWLYHRGYFFLKKRKINIFILASQSSASYY